MKLNQVIAIEKGIKSSAYSIISELHKQVQKRPLFDGFSRHYQPKDDQGEQLPPESKVVQLRAQDALGTVRIKLGELIDVTAQKELANTRAKADIRIDGEVLVSGAPVTLLLFLEKQLTDIRTFVSAIPVLDIAESWARDENSGMYRTSVVSTQRTQKVQEPLVLYPATDKHPAQTQVVTKDVIAGFWSTVKHSAALPAPEKEAMLIRTDKLLIAVKEAREEANDIDAGQREAVGARVFNYLFT